MVIAEALMQVKDLQSKLKEVKSSLTESVYVLKDDLGNTRNMDFLMDAADDLNKEINKLKLQIAKTNATVLVGGVSLATIIKDIEFLRSQLATLKEVTDKMKEKNSRFLQVGYGMTEKIPLVVNFALKEEVYVERMEAIRKQIRELEKKLVKANWSTELVA